MDLIPVSRPIISDEDIQVVTKTLSEGKISGDTDIIRNFELEFSRFLGTPNTITVNSGTAALDLLYETLGVRPGDEWVVPTFTITSTVNNLLRRGAKLHIVDADRITWSMDTNSLENIESNSISGAVITHIFGLAANFSSIKQFFNQNVPLIEDAAEALGTQYLEKMCGTLGFAGIFSFYANKVITSGEGGAIVTDNDEFAEKLRYYRNLCFGKERFVHEELGWNYRMPSISAALLTSQLSRIEHILRHKMEIAKRYREGLINLPNIELMTNETAYSKNTYWVFPILMNKSSRISRSEVQLQLKQLGVETRRFFCPIHLQPYLRKYDFNLVGNMSFSEELWDRGFYLPSGTGITFKEVDMVIEKLYKILG